MLEKIKTIFRDYVIILFTIHAPTREGASRSSVPRDKNEVPAIHQQYYLLRILCKRGKAIWRPSCTTFDVAHFDLLLWKNCRSGISTASVV